METTLNHPNSKGSYKIDKTISILVIVFVSIALLLGSQFVNNKLLPLISQDGFHIPNIQQSIPKNTFFEFIIALLNIILATLVLIDSRFIRPIAHVPDNSPSSQSFRQLVFGWRMLWFGWILLYTSLAIGWLGSVSSILVVITNVFNVMNGFFFYYLFFVLDTYSVNTKSDKKRNKGFKLNILITLFVGVLVLAFSTLVSWDFRSDENNNFFVNNLIAAYTAVGMVFFFGRLDSHYLNLSRIVLAPLYLYAVIQLFWISDIFDKSVTSANRIVIFTVALILKVVIFYLVSKEIREGVFYRYMKDAVTGIEKKRKLELAIEEVKANESILEIYIQPPNNLDTITKRLEAINSIYLEVGDLLNISTDKYPLKVIMIESGSLKSLLVGESKIMAKIVDFAVDFANDSKKFLYHNYTEEGKRERKRIEIDKDINIAKTLIGLNVEAQNSNLKINESEKLLEKNIEKINIKFAELLNDEKNIKVIEEEFPNGPVIKRIISEENNIQLLENGS